MYTSDKTSPTLFAVVRKRFIWWVMFLSAATLVLILTEISSTVDCSRIQKKSQQFLSETSANNSCKPHSKPCNDGKCIKLQYFCDKFYHCQDGSDEKFCEAFDPNLMQNNLFTIQRNSHIEVLVEKPLCNVTLCQLPNCFCSENGTSIPGNLPPNDIPQMIGITFDDEITFEQMSSIFDGVRKNPNGCNIKGTFFVSHRYANYSVVQKIHTMGHEVGAHSVTHNSNVRLWRKGVVEFWEQEMVGSRNLLKKRGLINDGSVLGIKAPYSASGGDDQFEMMDANRFLYDTSLQAYFSNPPIWPYTLQFKIPKLAPELLKSHNSWEVPRNSFDNSLDDETPAEPMCGTMGKCFRATSAQNFYDLLNFNFKRHYTQNRAPFSLQFHWHYFTTNHGYQRAFVNWIDHILRTYDDVYFVTLTQIIRWIQTPKNINQSKTFHQWMNKC